MIRYGAFPAGDPRGSYRLSHWLGGACPLGTFGAEQQVRCENKIGIASNCYFPILTLLLMVYTGYPNELCTVQ